MSDPVIRNPHAPAAASPTLVEFMTARLDEDEHYARYVLVDLEDGDPPVAESWHEGASGILDVGCNQFPLSDSRLSRFIERHDPARVLAEVTANRAIVKRLHHQPETGIRNGDEEYVSCACGWDRVLDRSFDWDDEYAVHLAELGVNDTITDAVLRALALPFADHPDYREEWKP